MDEGTLEGCAIIGSRPVGSEGLKHTVCLSSTVRISLAAMISQVR